VISEEKMSHVLHLMLDGIEKAGLASFTDKELAIRESRKACFQYISQFGQVAELARKKILSMKNPPPEFSNQWEALYKKFYEEEMNKLGG
jgi:hypothetical protein